jgi:hypothetical protein
MMLGVKLNSQIVDKIELDFEEIDVLLLVIVMQYIEGTQKLCNHELEM